MRPNVIRISWGLIAVGVVALAVVVTVGALRANGDSAFNRWVGWATIWALVIATVGVLPVVWDRAFPNNVPGDVSTITDQLAKAVYHEATDLRRRLVDLGNVGDKPANVRFAKIHGRFREVGGPRGGDLQSVLHYYRSLLPARLVILGEPGAGKTVLAIELQICLLDERKQDPTLPVPVLVSAATYDARQEWDRWLAAHLAVRFAMSMAAATEIIQGGWILPILDGLDEMDPAGTPVARAKGEGNRSGVPGAAGIGPGRPARAARLVTGLNKSFQGRKPSPVVVTCRPEEYKELERGVDGAALVEMIPLDGDESADYLEGQFGVEDEAQRWAPVIKALRADPAGPVAVLLGTPWRLTLALGAFRDGGEPAALLPAGPGGPPAALGDAVMAVDRQLLGQYIEGAARRAKITRYQAADVQRWLAALACGLARQASLAKSATDIELATWWQPSGPWTARLAHTVLLLFPLAAALPWLWFTGGWFGISHPELDGSWLPGVYAWHEIAKTAAPFGPGWLALFLLVFGVLASRSPLPRRLAVWQMITWRGVRRFVRGFAFGLFPGLVCGLVLSIGQLNLRVGMGQGAGFSVYTPSTWYLPSLLGYLRGDTQLMRIGLLGLMCGSVFGLAAGLADPTPRPVGPRDVIRADARYLAGVVVVFTLMLSLGGALYSVIPSPGSGGPEAWWTMQQLLAGGAEFGLAIGFWIGVAGASGRGSSAWTRYRITVVVNWLFRRAPLRFGAFLDWSRDAGLLRVSGVAYQFRHRQLQEWLTAQEDQPR
jgi:hypothetical protein